MISTVPPWRPLEPASLHMRNQTNVHFGTIMALMDITWVQICYQLYITKPVEPEKNSNALELSHTLLNPAPAAPFIHIGTVQLQALLQLPYIFMAALPPSTNINPTFASCFPGLFAVQEHIPFCPCAHDRFPIPRDSLSGTHLPCNSTPVAMPHPVCISEGDPQSGTIFEGGSYTEPQACSISEGGSCHPTSQGHVFHTTSCSTECPLCTPRHGG
jgi:hypothetical protein